MNPFPKQWSDAEWAALPLGVQQAMMASAEGGMAGVGRNLTPEQVQTIQQLTPGTADAWQHGRPSVGPAASMGPRTEGSAPSMDWTGGGRYLTQGAPMADPTRRVGMESTAPLAGNYADVRTSAAPGVTATAAERAQYTPEQWAIKQGWKTGGLPSGGGLPGMGGPAPAYQNGVVQQSVYNPNAAPADPVRRVGGSDIGPLGGAPMQGDPSGTRGNPFGPGYLQQNPNADQQYQQWVSEGGDGTPESFRDFVVNALGAPDPGEASGNGYGGAPTDPWQSEGGGGNTSPAPARPLGDGPGEPPPGYIFNPNWVGYGPGQYIEDRNFVTPSQQSTIDRNNRPPVGRAAPAMTIVNTPGPLQDSTVAQRNAQADASAAAAANNRAKAESGLYDAQTADLQRRADAGDQAAARAIAVNERDFANQEAWRSQNRADTLGQQGTVNAQNNRTADQRDAAAQRAIQEDERNFANAEAWRGVAQGNVQFGQGITESGVTGFYGGQQTQAAMKQAADIADQRARTALAQGNADEARRQFDISSKLQDRIQSGNLAVSQGNFNLQAQQQAWQQSKDPFSYIEKMGGLRGGPAVAGSGMNAPIALPPSGSAYGGAPAPATGGAAGAAPVIPNGGIPTGAGWGSTGPSGGIIDTTRNPATGVYEPSTGGAGGFNETGYDRRQEMVGQPTPLGAPAVNPEANRTRLGAYPQADADPIRRTAAVSSAPLAPSPVTSVTSSPYTPPAIRDVFSGRAPAAAQSALPFLSAQRKNSLLPSELAGVGAAALASGIDPADYFAQGDRLSHTTAPRQVATTTLAPRRRAYAYGGAPMAA